MKKELILLGKNPESSSALIILSLYIFTNDFRVSSNQDISNKRRSIGTRLW